MSRRRKKRGGRKIEGLRVGAESLDGPGQGILQKTERGVRAIGSNPSFSLDRWMWAGLSDPGRMGDYQRGTSSRRGT